MIFFFNVIAMVIVVMIAGTGLNLLLMSFLPKGWDVKNEYVFTTVKAVIDSLYLTLGAYAIGCSVNTLAYVSVVTFVFSVMMFILTKYFKQKTKKLSEALNELPD